MRCAAAVTVSATAVNRACVRSSPLCGTVHMQSWCLGRPNIRLGPETRVTRIAAVPSDSWAGLPHGPTGLVQAQVSFSGRLAASSATIALLWLPKRQLSCCAHLFKRHTIPSLSPGITATQDLHGLGLPQNSASEVGTRTEISRSSRAWAWPSSNSIIYLPTTESHVSSFIISTPQGLVSLKASTFGTQAHPCLLIVVERLIPR